MSDNVLRASIVQFDGRDGMSGSLDHVADAFEANVASVDDLIDFDQTILDLATSNLPAVIASLEAAGKQQFAKDVKNRLTVLQNMRKHDSMKKHYGTIFSQCVVLLVSYFSSAVSELFKNATTTALNSDLDIPMKHTEVKLAWRDLAAHPAEAALVFSDLVVAQKDISFQDMQSIARAFAAYFEVEITRDAHVNNIIAGQAARHAIVHAGGVVDTRMVKQLASATPRTLKPTIASGESISFMPSEVRLLAESMKMYIRNVTNALLVRLAG